MNQATTDAAAVAALLRLEERRQKATIELDYATLDEILAEDLIFINGKGRKLDRAGHYAFLRDTVRTTAIERKIPHVSVYGDAALMHGDITYYFTEMDSGAKKSLTVRLSQVWARRGDTWVQALYHVTRMTYM
jgi:ketosteroid isomerase-like protein